LVNGALNAAVVTDIDLLEDNRDTKLLGKHRDSFISMLLEDIKDH
jgi:hypothetical protein